MPPRQHATNATSLRRWSITRVPTARGRGRPPADNRQPIRPPRPSQRRPSSQNPGVVTPRVHQAPENRELPQPRPNRVMIGTLARRAADPRQRRRRARKKALPYLVGGPVALVSLTTLMQTLADAMAGDDAASRRQLSSYTNESCQANEGLETDSEGVALVLYILGILVCFLGVRFASPSPVIAPICCFIGCASRSPCPLVVARLAISCASCCPSAAPLAHPCLSRLAFHSSRCCATTTSRAA